MSEDTQVSTEIVEPETTETVEVQTQDASQVTLSLNDLGVLANIINLATTRGTFKANELSAVGAAYDKLSLFLTAAQAQQSATAESTDAPSV